MNVQDLINKKMELRGELRQVEAEIAKIQRECKHKNSYQTRRYQDPGSGRTTYDYTCPDCKLDY